MSADQTNPAGGPGLRARRWPWPRPRTGAFVTGLLGLVSLLARPALAQADGAVGDPAPDDPVSGVEEHVDMGPATLDLEYQAGLLGGSYMQTGALGVLAETALKASLEPGRHELYGELTYLYDPFSMKAFNFDEASSDDTSARLVQWMHELGGGLGWDTDWTEWLATGLEARSSYRWTELAADRRWALYLDGDARLGADWNDPGLYMKLGGQAFFRTYPDYRVADRSLDQRGAEGRLEGGYSFGRDGELGLAYEVRLTNYLDARYDQIDSGGQVVRADESKSYLRHAFIADGVWRSSRSLRLGLRYSFQRNDAHNYDREMTGRDASGNLEARFLRDYYDYSRHRLRASARWHTPVAGLDVGVVTEYWLRLFDSYIARDTTNRWLDEARVDHDVELGLEVAYQLAQLGSNRVALTAMLSHASRRSNMERELSFATNFDVTRLFLGLEVHN